MSDVNFIYLSLIVLCGLNIHYFFKASMLETKLNIAYEASKTSIDGLIYYRKKILNIESELAQISKENKK